MEFCEVFSGGESNRAVVWCRDRVEMFVVMLQQKIKNYSYYYLFILRDSSLWCFLSSPVLNWSGCLIVFVLHLWRRQQYHAQFHHQEMMMKLTGDLANDWDEFRSEFEDYMLAMGLEQKDKEVQAAALQRVMCSECRHMYKHNLGLSVQYRDLKEDLRDRLVLAAFDEAVCHRLLRKKKKSHSN